MYRKHIITYTMFCFKRASSLEHFLKQFHLKIQILSSMERGFLIIFYGRSSIEGYRVGPAIPLKISAILI